MSKATSGNISKSDLMFLHSVLDKMLQQVWIQEDSKNTGTQ